MVAVKGAAGEGGGDCLVSRLLEESSPDALLDGLFRRWNYAGDETEPGDDEIREGSIG